MSTRVGMGVDKPGKDTRADSVVKKENTELKAKLKEAEAYAENANKKIAALETENAELKAAAGGKTE